VRQGFWPGGKHRAHAGFNSARSRDFITGVFSWTNCSGAPYGQKN
jgi:hypothetical protein